ncbi:calcineurin-like phosphoesterase [Pestalotiopsis sp. NC0098]|nr:calcineurin-like phosphoesterase [Pestalotiopsis sp. NC0098]
MVALCLSPHLHPRTRRRRFIALIAVFVFGTLYLGYTKFDKMAETAKTMMPLKTPEGGLGLGFGSSGASPAQSQPPSQPQSQAQAESHPSFADLAALEQKPMPPMSYGTYARPPLKGLKALETLPSSKLPTSSPSSPRLIVIGDVHGQLKELKALLAKVEYSKERGDHVILTGDLINKGPDSPGVVQLAMDIGASGVRGNHEDRILLAHANSEARNVIGPSGSGGKISDLKGSTPSSADDMDEPSLAGQSGSQSAELQIARSLTKQQRDWLADLPVILKVGPIEGYGNVVVVHAGLVPGVALENQDPWAVMHMRTLVYPAEEVRRQRIKKVLEDYASQQAKKHISVPNAEVDKELELSKQRGDGAGDHDVSLPTEGRDGQSWSDAWNESQGKIKSDSDKTTVVYGHDAKKGLNVQKYSYGLDSSCVRGGQLTAMVFEPQSGKIGHRIVSVDCEAVAGLDKDDDEKKRRKRGEDKAES